MERILLLHSSREGQTIKILDYIATKMGSDVQCELVDLHQPLTVSFADYDRVVIGASIRYGHLNKKLYQFIAKHQIALEKTKAAFFIVNLTARKEGKDTPETSVYFKKFLLKSPWVPALQDTFAGALFYPRYNFFDRIMIQLIMRMTGGETDPTKEVEYTNWQRVDQFVDKIKLG
ncbi:menaquinone-dependent protoporphyrinogen IX dehydrogenase [Aliivibrio finisterrensis]|uniref:Protoporphyrinogen IX dehydrogenase [quinone] n=1 Tax=Aliivibrio finisterrensis TaxID=511998 RepID=A0A6N6RTI6_9GAMM|nr:menaquinone-dependent protoporphyrinogen IX dehydrogenase [Aliivibrio finisterrensis]KAB2824934.1 menaquinone-dependent protoporphyrinogen IX dehydrogenase [Aliivibrio finisterrensis]